MEQTLHFLYQIVCDFLTRKQKQNKTTQKHTQKTNEQKKLPLQEGKNHIRYSDINGNRVSAFKLSTELAEVNIPPLENP